MPDRPAGAGVDGGLRPALKQVEQHPRLVGRELVEDPVVRRVPLLIGPDVAGAVEQLGPSLAQAFTGILGGSSDGPYRSASRVWRASTTSDTAAS